MTENTLTDRYVAAATRSVPEAQRADVAAELRGSIGDQIDARVETGEERDSAERAVLIELGDPERLAAGYTGRPLYLIGPEHYLDWWRLTRLLLWIVVPLSAFGLALAQTIAGADIGAILGSALGGAISVAVNIVFWITLVFAIIERSRRRTGPVMRWTLDQLPAPRQTGTGVGEVVSAFVGVFAAGAVLAWDHWIGFVPGVAVSFFDEALWPAGVLYAMLVLAIDAMVLVVVHVVRRWTIPLAVASALLNLAFAIPALWLLTQGLLLNPDYFPTVLPEGGADVQGIITVIIGFLIAGITVWNIIDRFRKAIAARG